MYALQYPKINRETTLVDNRVYTDAYQMLTKSLVQGKISIDFPETYKQQLLELENYKDYSERDKSGIQYLFDFSFYEGNYYCYYGIVPVLTVLLPIALIFKQFLRSYVIGIIYTAGNLILMLLIYKNILKKYKINMSFLLELLGYIVLIISTGIPFLMGHTDFYSAVCLTGIFWGMLAAYLTMQLENEKRTIPKLIAIGISYGLMVCSRPIYVLYIIPLIIGIYPYIIKNKKIKIKRLLAISIPITIIAVAQMCYNYIRYDNIFEFGQFYQLTINNPEDQKMDIGMSIEGVLTYLINPPQFKEEFPFIEKTVPSVNNGNVIFQSSIYGFVWFPYLWIMFSYKNSKDNKKLKKLGICLAILTVAILSIDTCLAGMNQRYMLDVQPALAIYSLVMWHKYLEKNEDRLHIYKRVCIISLIIGILFIFTELNYGQLTNAFELKYMQRGQIQYNIEKMIYFYK